MPENNWESNGKDRETMRVALNKLSQAMYRPDPVPRMEAPKTQLKPKSKKMGKNKGCN